MPLNIEIGLKAYAELPILHMEEEKKREKGNLKKNFGVRV